MPLVRDAKCDPNLAIQQWFNPYGTKCNFHSKEYRAPRKKSFFLDLAAHKKMPFGKC